MDTDGDGIPDGRDPHPNTPDPDRDGDGIPDDEDPHPDTPDPDRDGDGIPDDVDPHPDTPDPRPRPAHSSGDPHLRTFDGLAYDFQALGEFVSVKGRGFEVQTRQVPLNDLVSYNSAVAIRFGAITVQLNATGDRLLVNGRPVDLAPLSAVQVGDGSIYRSDDGTGQPTYTVSDGHGNGITVAVTSWLGHALLDVTAFVAGNQAGQVSGLLGNADGDAADDIRLADGTVLHAPVVTRDLYGVFADSWRVTDATSLFTYAAGETTATYTDSSFPHALVTVDGLDPAARAAGEAAAMAAGLMPGTVAYENAVLDVALIGDPTVVVSAASTAAGPEPQKLDLDQAPAFAGPLLVVIVANTASAPLAIGASDADADPLSFAVKSGAQPAKGSVTINQADGSLVYTPQHDAIGSDGFILVVSDGRGGTTEQYVSVAITPVASPDITTTTEDARIVSASLFGNDTNADGSLRVAAVNGVAANVGTRIPLASGAWLTVRADGSYDYDPNHAFDSLTTVAGATNHTGVDSFTYSVVGGNTVSVTVTITGANSPGDQAQGTAGNDTLTGTASSEYFNLSAGGDDTASGGAGADTFFLGAAFTAADRIDGGSGNDQIGLQGNYTGANALVLSPTTVTNVETIALLGNFSYDLTTNDANIAASQTMAFYGSELQAGTTFTLNASAETDGRVLVYGGLGADTITTGAGNDGIYFGRGGRFDPTTDHVDGGAGTDQFALDGSYTVTISGQQIVNIETLALLDGTPSTPAIYNVTLADDWATGSQTKTIYFADVRSDAIVDGSAETSANFTFFGGRGNDIIKGGAGNDTIYGGPGADTLTGGAGADTFAYTAVSDSIGTSHDIIVGFDPSQDKIDLPFTVTGIDAATSGNASAGTLDTDLTNALATLASHHAVQFTATGGDLAGHVFEVIDANGVAGYQAGQDVVIELQAPVAPIIHPTPFI